MILVNMRCDCENPECHLKLWAKNMKGNGWPFKSQVFYRGHWLHTSGIEGLEYDWHVMLLWI